MSVRGVVRASALLFSDLVNRLNSQRVFHVCSCFKLHKLTVARGRRTSQLLRLTKFLVRLAAPMQLMSKAALVRESRRIAPNAGAVVTGYASATNDVPPDVPRMEKPFRAAELVRRIAQLTGGEALG